MRSRGFGLPAGGKTGSSRDGWFGGFTSKLVCVVWVGFDDHRTLGARETGGRTALPIWVHAMRSAIGERPRTEFPQPSGVVTVAVDPRTGLLPYIGQDTVLSEVFLDGTAPTETAPEPGTLDAASFLMQDESEPAPAPEPAPTAP